MSQDPTILHSRLRQLAAHAKAMRAAQKAFFSLPNVMDQKTKADFLNASKTKERLLDDYLRQLDFEKLL